jgi:uncharacterized membrane protein
LKTAVVGLFPDLRHAQDAVNDLVAEGFTRDTISLMANDVEGDIAEEVRIHEEGSAAAAGAGSGAVLGGATGLFLGLVSLAVPGVGAVVAAGPILAALSGALVGAAAGGLIGALVDLGVPEEHAHYYAEGVRRGGTVVTVQTDESRAQRAVEIMQIRGVIDINSHVAAWRNEGWKGYDPATPPLSREELQRIRGSQSSRRAA